MKPTYRFAIIVAALGLISGALQPALASTTTLTAQADSFVSSSTPNAKKGSATLLKVNDDIKRAYFRFNLSSLPAGETITKATLKLFATTKPRCARGAEIVRAATEAWTESSITWNNQPGTTGSAVASVVSWTANSYVSFGVTSAVSSSGTITFVVRHPSDCTPTGDAVFQSREATNKPQLVVETTPGTATPQCSDGQDNDGDGLTDHPADPGCTDTNDNDERDAAPPTQSCGVSSDHTVCVTLPSTTLSGTESITVTNNPNNGHLFIYWVPDGGTEIYLRQAFVPDPITNDYSFDWPTHKYLDATGVLRFRAVSATATPVDIPVTLSNGNTSDFQHNPSDWQDYLPGAWTQSSDPIVPAVGDGPSDTASANNVAALIDRSNPPLALFLGDIYEKSTHTELINNYGFSALDSPSPTLWGSFADVTQPTLGNHDFSPNLAHWTDYWHGRPRFMKFDFGGVLFLNLDSNASGAFQQGSAQYQFVQSALTSSAPPCVIAYAHHPVLTGSSVNSSKLPMWQLLANNGADLYVVGHAHYMAEYRPLDANLTSGPGAHLIQMISGAGGFQVAAGASDSRQVFLKGRTPGAVFLTLDGAANGGTATSISWEWKDTNGDTLHRGSTSC